jgi:hypothetical protein
MGTFSMFEAWRGRIMDFMGVVSIRIGNKENWARQEVTPGSAVRVALSLVVKGG